MQRTKPHKCLFCGALLHHIFADLGSAPPSNAFLSAEQCEEPEVFHPLRVYACEKCLLVQSPFYRRPQDIFTHDYAYHSSWSPSWVRHAREYVENVCERFGLNEKSFIVELGSNDGYLLQHAVARGVPCLGIDPSSSAATIAMLRGVTTLTDFFTARLARQLAHSGKRADLICGINVFAHVPAINDFIRGMRLLLKPRGVLTMEFPHLLRLVEDVQFDTIYHEHYFYYSLLAVRTMLAAHRLRVFDVERLSTHGGSLRVYACRQEASHVESPAIAQLLQEEERVGMHSIDYYTDFQHRILKIRSAILSFLIDVQAKGKSVIGYGAAAKGNTLINYFGIRRDLLPLVVDVSPQKQGKFLPGSRIPVQTPDRIREVRPDYLFVLAWNLIEEIMEQHRYIGAWGGKFVTAIPELKVMTA